MFPPLYFSNFASLDMYMAALATLWFFRILLSKGTKVNPGTTPNFDELFSIGNSNLKLHKLCLLRIYPAVHNIIYLKNIYLDPCVESEDKNLKISGCTSV